MERIVWRRKEGRETMQKMTEVRKNGIVWLEFPALRESGLVKHAFSTRIGGVSEGVWSSMNFSFTRGDDPEHVKENYRRMAEALDVKMDKMTLSQQTHTTNIKIVSENEAGKGVVRDRDYTDIDGLITNVPGITLVTFFADCVPLYILDPVHKAIGMSHSGWRGTVNRMGKVTLDAMHTEYGTDPGDVIACIGPSICLDCFEVGPEVAESFEKEFSKEYHEQLFYQKDNGKYQLDLWKANQIVFTEAGVRADNIYTTDICTRCNPQVLFSHRIQGNARGNLAAFFGLNT